MTPLVDGWNVVIAGHWNPAIFSPEWIINRLTRAQEIGVEVAMAPVSANVRLRFDSLHLRVGQRRLIMGLDQPDDASLNRLQPVIVQILQTLPHTPVSAIGCNFQFLERNPGAGLLRTFDLNDHGDLADLGLVVRDTTVKRTFEVENLTLNLQLATRNDGVVFSFNFHHQCASANDALAFLANRQLGGLRDLSLRILQGAYRLEEAHA